MLLLISAIVIPVISILVNSDVFVAQLFTDFYVELTTGQPDPTISVSNVGQVQANNVVLVIHLNDTVDGFLDMCPEGHMYQMNQKILVAEFQRMSPQMVCHFPLIVSEPIHHIATFAASDHRGLWFSGLPISNSVLHGLILLFVFEIVMLLLIFPSPILRISLWIDNLNTSDKLKQTDLADKTYEFVLNEYGVKIRSIDGYILELVYLKRTTKTQLRTYTKLSELEIIYRIWKMRQLELILKEEMILDVALGEHFEYYDEYV